MSGRGIGDWVVFAEDPDGGASSEPCGSPFPEQTPIPMRKTTEASTAPCARSGSRRKAVLTRVQAEASTTFERNRPFLALPRKEVVRDASCDSQTVRVESEDVAGAETVGSSVSEVDDAAASDDSAVSASEEPSSSAVVSLARPSGDDARKVRLHSGHSSSEPSREGSMARGCPQCGQAILISSGGSLMVFVSFGASQGSGRGARVRARVPT